MDFRQLVQCRLGIQTTAGTRSDSSLLTVESPRQSARHHAAPKQQGADEREFDIEQFVGLTRQIDDGCWKHTRHPIHHQETRKQDRCPNRAPWQKRRPNVQGNDHEDCY